MAYTVNLSSNNSGTLSQTRFENMGMGGSGSISATYTPTAVGGHTLTATITDNEGKSKSVAVTLSSSLPPYDNSTVNEYEDIYHGGVGGPSKLNGSRQL